MPAPSQANGPIAVTTPLGPDALLLTDFEAHEAISQLFRFRLDLLALNKTKVPFEGIVGKDVTVQIWLPGGQKRYFNGIVNRFSQGHRDDTFTSFRAEVVPRLWQLTRRVQSRIFQDVTVPEILKRVLAELDVKFEILDAYRPRDYCVQYRESDFAFASRLMEEEGIHYFFTHTDGQHQMVVSDVPDVHSDLPGQATVIFETMVRGGSQVGPRAEMRVTGWEKTQELRSGTYTLWDHCFELPGQTLEAREFTLGSVQAGTVVHPLRVGGNEQWEIYDYPGGYAQRFDGVDRTGADHHADLAWIVPDGERTAGIRMQQEQAPSLEIQGVGNCRHFLPGRQFNLTRHFDGDGAYLLTRVVHHAHWGSDFRTSDRPAFEYENEFTCIPTTLPYRPLRVTPRPLIPGAQTATVVGPPGTEIFCDKYGRVKVQFHWDREGKRNGDSSCWVRVAQPWAGKRWGAFFWPRLGHEVVVLFEEGDPDQPLIVGSVYNFENMPPYPLPARNQFAGIRSASVRGTASQHYNAVVFVDAKGHEHLGLHSERDMSFNAEFDKMFHGGRHRGERISASSILTVGSLPGQGGVILAGPGRTPDFSGEACPSGGGSGGGPEEDREHKVGPALSSEMIYGDKFEGLLGLKHEVIVGSNLALCVNPVSLFAEAIDPSSPVNLILGSGLGGDMSLTLGTKADIVFGKVFDINLGKKKYDVEQGESKYGLSTALCLVLVTAAVVYVVSYGLFESDAARATLTVSFQALVSVLLVSLMLNIDLDKKGDQAIDDASRAMFREALELRKVKSTQRAVSQITAGLLALGALATPPLLAALAEAHAPPEKEG